MIIKINKAQGKVIVAICDEEILGKIFEHDCLILDLSADFYKGNKESEQITREIMKKADNLNLVGEKTIQIALDEKIITKGNIRTIQNIPFA